MDGEEKEKTKDDGIVIRFKTESASNHQSDNEGADEEEEEEEEFEGIAFLPATSPISNISSSSGKRQVNKL
jgi:hypothetical protein